MKNRKHALRCLCECAVLVALAQILGYLKLYELPQGGSVTPAMLPLALLCARWGFGPGVAACTLFGLLQLVLDGAYTWGWVSIFFDYLIAFGLMGTAGLLCKSRYNLVLGSILGCAARFCSHLVSGVLYVAGTTGLSIYGVDTASPWLYSAIYNGAYMLPTMVLTVVLGLLLQKPLQKYLRREDLLQ